MSSPTYIALLGFGAEQSPAEKKREYNRNAQKIFRRKRKEHLGELENAQKKHFLEQSRELQTLRHENKLLATENESLRLRRGTLHAVNTIESERSALVLCTSPHSTCFEKTASTSPPPAPPSEISELASSFMLGMAVIMPSDIAKIRWTLHGLFAPVLETCSSSDPRRHLQALRALAPSLPESLKPTRLQLLVPHHPHIDMLPSPVLRDRLIAAGPVPSKIFVTQVCTIALNIEDNGQITVWGEDWDDVGSWEFSAPVLECWGGWLLTQEWVDRANFWRRQRGAVILSR